MIPKGTKMTFEAIVQDSNGEEEVWTDGMFALTRHEADVVRGVINMYIEDRGGLEAYISGHGIPYLDPEELETKYKQYMDYRRDVAQLYSFLDLQLGEE